MIVSIPDVFSPADTAAMRAQLEAATDAWVDGRATAGYQGAPVKRNQQIAEGSSIALEMGDRIIAALERHPLFISAALPNKVYPPLFNRYEGGMHFGSHVDGAIRLVPGSGVRVRTDLSVTLFLTPPDEYDGGELLIEDTFGVQEVKLPAGHAILYPGTSLHQVRPVTRGARVSSFFWVQSLVRDDTQRAMLFDIDGAIQRLNASNADDAARRTLVGCYHNLLRMWSET
ncbi:PKHD-type hydroxylase [Paraburkholderia sp. GV068]|jgi:PKHD-type hydroxylase|uniref:2OG-Fe(II) oxygenase n=1 Tax=Paraburkholderia graminis (strain ATCC 700544 / DSM 17151 / LMG 18924 / NCIMB 13744 / C4D1M) TaxID=396598 RepID=B1G3U4_PARG4|nr:MULTISPECIES: Fe2+-dependent dioxygenase [Paraburkholderia]EDT09270.1 2OG-Fe(II) oxygenase [Paraburkholderia graminis C4D1M]MDR6469363.1 PKHD-type hydroxylase [Paraburkholderia graminis]MDR6474501.1 PKHD-type hydroxylase [Paraburkholderia graminis]PTQ96270.1 PKHD-type hydroxylase [Paraburkholderia sp. GV072]PUA94662.1 PKHD-type hydroxylase [Paraburkholderia sp. GV068]